VDILKIINQTVPKALSELQYTNDEVSDIINYAVGYGTLKDAPGVNHESLKEKGFTDEILMF
jgi:ribonucleoside-diphosphate reductase alpha chain